MVRSPFQVADLPQRYLKLPKNLKLTKIKSNQRTTSLLARKSNPISYRSSTRKRLSPEKAQTKIKKTKGLAREIGTLS